MIGCCLATGEELSAARDGAEHGEWAAATRLPGSYLSVVRTGPARRITGTRAGVVTVYWLPVDDGVLWATAAAPLAAYAGAEPDPAALLSAFTLRGVDLAEASHFRTVRRVPPDHALDLEAGADPRIEPVPHPARERSFAESALLVRETVTSGITRRTVGTDRLSTDLSGGIDSSVITSLAATRALLLAVTYTDDRMGEQDDMRYAERTAASNSAITHAWVHGSRASVQHFDAERSGEVPVLARAGPEAGEEGLPGEGLRPAGRWRPCPR